MAEKQNPNQPAAGTSSAPEMNNPDFQAGLKALLAVYQPILEQQLSLAKNPDELQKQAQAAPSRTCAQEFEEAYAMFAKFWNEDTAMRLLPPQAKELLGPIDQWRWCLQHILCCLVFGWLVCRWPRTFRGYAYYLYEFWRCVRQVIGNPVHDPPTEAERRDFDALVKILAEAYKPFLTDQLATVEYPAGVPEEIFSGEIDCFVDNPEACIIFDRLLTTEAARALLGEAAFKQHSEQSFFWFCRCFCLCALCFGCCLARARNIQQVVLCLYAYWRCLFDCFRPIRCDLTAPSGCAEEKPGLPGIPAGDVGLEIDGTAAGAFFDHYTLEWRITGQACDDPTGWNNGGIGLISYPGGGATGTIAVVGGTLGWLDTTFLGADSYDIRLTVFSTSGQQACQLCLTFTLFKKLVFITRVAENPGAFVATPPGPFVGTSPIVSSNPAPPGVVVPVGGPVSVWGAAFVGECANLKIKCIDLRAAKDFQVGPEDPLFPPTLPLYTIGMLTAPICYDDVPPLDQIKKRLVRLDSPLCELTAFWKHLTTLPGQPWMLKPNPFDSGTLLFPCPDPQHGCYSGPYTILLDVSDTHLPKPNHYYDTQQVLFDNKPIHVEFSGLEGVGSCQDVCLSKFAPPGAPCNTCWPMKLQGIAFDENIDPADNTYPSNNFDYYSLWITRQGGPTYSVPITLSLCPPLFGPDQLKGTQRVGEPGTRCEESISGCSAPAHGSKSPALLTMIDLRIFDVVCAADPSFVAPFTPPAGFPLERGHCCGYTFQLYAQDQTWSDGWAGGFHHAWSLPWAVEICNDLDSNAKIPQCP